MKSMDEINRSERKTGRRELEGIEERNRRERWGPKDDKTRGKCKRRW